MSDSFWLVLAIVLYFGVMVAIGFYSCLLYTSPSPRD